MSALQEQQQYNQQVQRFARNTQAQLKQSARQIKDSGQLARSIGRRTRTRNGIINRVSFPLERYGIFRMRGVGRGRAVGSARARAVARDWINPVLDRNFQQIQGEIGEAFADLKVKKLNF